MSADAEKMRRHEERFEGTQKRRRRSTPNLKAQVLEPHSRGAVQAAVADLNVSDRRVREMKAAA
jgi:hypothetical protein